MDGGVAISKMEGGAGAITTIGLVGDPTAWTVLKMLAYDDILAFYVNGTQVAHVHDPLFESGSVGIFMLRPASSTGNKLSVDWAK
jgi:hypothetical protein